MIEALRPAHRPATPAGWSIPTAPSVRAKAPPAALGADRATRLAAVPSDRLRGELGDGEFKTLTARGAGLGDPAAVSYAVETLRRL